DSPAPLLPPPPPPRRPPNAPHHAPHHAPPPPPTHRQPGGGPANVDMHALGQALKPAFALVGVIFLVAGVIAWFDFGWFALREALGGLAAAFGAAVASSHSGTDASLSLLGVATVVGVILY